MRNWFNRYIESNLPIPGGGGGAETVPPGASATFPTSGDYAVARDGSVLIPVVDAASRVALIAIAVRFSNASNAEAIYIGDGGIAGFMPGYQARSSVSGTGAAGVGYTLTIRRDATWPRGAGAIFTVRAVDAAGNVLL